MTNINTLTEERRDRFFFEAKGSLNIRAISLLQARAGVRTETWLPSEKSKKFWKFSKSTPNPDLTLSLSVAQKPSVLVSLGCYNKTLKTGWLKQKMFISHSPRDDKFKTSVPADWFPSEGPLPGLTMTSFPLCSHMVERESMCTLLGLFFIKALISLWSPTLMTSPKPDYLPKAPPPSTMGVKVST